MTNIKYSILVGAAGLLPFVACGQINNADKAAPMTKDHLARLHTPMLYILGG